MGFRLRNGLSFAIGDGSAVFLDSKSNRYFQLSHDMNAIFLALATGPDGHIPPQGDRRRIEAAGLGLFDDEAGSPQQTTLLSASTHLVLNRRDLHINTGTVGAMTARIGMMIRLRYRGFACTMARLRVGKDRLALSTPDRAKALRIVATFAASHHFLSDVDRCLPSSMALAATLWKANIPVTLVLGVRLAPFRAHSWVQWDNEVLNDHIDHVRSFMPILVL